MTLNGFHHSGSPSKWNLKTFSEIESSMLILAQKKPYNKILNSKSYARIYEPWNGLYPFSFWIFKLVVWNKISNSKYVIMLGMFDTVQVYKLFFFSNIFRLLANKKYLISYNLSFIISVNKVQIFFINYKKAQFLCIILHISIGL